MKTFYQWITFKIEVYDPENDDIKDIEDDWLYRKNRKRPFNHPYTEPEPNIVKPTSYQQKIPTNQQISQPKKPLKLPIKTPGFTVYKHEIILPCPKCRFEIRMPSINYNQWGVPGRLTCPMCKNKWNPNKVKKVIDNA